MENIIVYIKEHLIRLVLDLIIIVLIVILFFMVSDKNKIEEENKVEQIAYFKEEEKTNKVKVDIKGAVKKEGVYVVDENLTINDVINLSGGLNKDAVTSNINLAKKVRDEMVIYVSKKSDIKKIDTCKKDVVETSDISSDDIYVKDYNNTLKNEEIKKVKEENKIININTASKEELLTLSGLGESKALAIISYREKTPFTTIEDIKNVSGIKDNLFNKIKDYITV